MRSPLRKQLLIGTIGILILGGILFSLPPMRTEYHKARLQSLKQKRSRLVTRGLTGMDKFWLQLTGKPISVPDLDAAIHKHESALVNLGFLHQHSLPAQMVSACPQTLETLTALRDECPWYDVETVSTNLVLTACPGMMDGWRKRAQQLGW
jgi:hypothetical protein